MQWIAQHKLLFVASIVVLGAVVWYGLSTSAPASPILTTGTLTGSPTTDSSDQQLVATLLALRAVKLGGTIFTDPAFTSLIDFSTPIVPEPIGRANPFAPANRDAETTDAQSATQLFTPSR